MASPLFDAQGCLTTEAFASIAAAPPGRAPAELAAHLASCVRCQRRLLASSSPAGESSVRRERPPLWRTAIVVAACLVLVVIALILLRNLGG